MAKTGLNAIRLRTLSMKGTRPAAGILEAALRPGGKGSAGKKTAAKKKPKKKPIY